MPSDEGMDIALRTLAGAIEKYRSAVVTTAEEVRGFLASHQPPSTSRDEYLAVSLGSFAASRVDVGRFSTLVGDSSGEDAKIRQKVEGAYAILNGIASGDDNLFRLDLKSGDRVGWAVSNRLAEVGRVFAAGRIAGLATRGSLNSTNDDKSLEGLEFEAWTSAERVVAPPLAVEIDGADLRAGELAGFLDGNVKIVLVVRGETAPAPLARLISPSVFVVQTADETGLDRFARYEGPAVAALVPENAARFIHDPSAGDTLGERLEVLHLPETTPKKAVGGMSARQQIDELEQLKALASCVGQSAVPAEGEAPQAEQMVSDHPVDKLAAWLLSQADLSDL